MHYTNTDKNKVKTTELTERLTTYSQKSKTPKITSKNLGDICGSSHLESYLFGSTVKNVFSTFG